MSDRLAVLPQYLLPKQALTQLMGKLAGLEGGSATTAVIRWFIQRYKVNMSEALEADPAAYKSFNQFFTRPLRPGVRPLADADWVCPAPSASWAASPALRATRFFRPKATTTAPRPWSAAMPPWPRNLPMGTLPPST